MARFLIVIEKAKNNYSAYSPDVPGCIATGKTVAETQANMYEALQFHFEGLQEDGIPIPEPQSEAVYMFISDHAADPVLDGASSGYGKGARLTEQKVITTASTTAKQAGGIRKATKKVKRA